MEVGKAVAARIKEMAGGRLHVFEEPSPHPGAILTWRYDCPCGEVSGYSVVIEHVHSDAYINYQVDVALTAMRRHVRSEGNEPSF